MKLSTIFQQRAAFDFNFQEKRKDYDQILLWVLLCLLAFGLIMVYSASIAQAGLTNFANRNVFFIKQAQFAIIGILLSFFIVSCANVEMAALDETCFTYIFGYFSDFAICR